MKMFAALLSFVLFTHFSFARVVPRTPDLATAIENLEMDGFEKAPRGSNSLLALDNSVECYDRISPQSPVSSEAGSFEQADAIRAKNLLLSKLYAKSNFIAKIPSEEMISQRSESAVALALNVGPERADANIPIHVIDQAFWMIIEHCVKSHDMIGTLTSRGGIKVAILEDENKSKSENGKSPWTEDRKADRQSLRCALVFGLFGFLSLI